MKKELLTLLLALTLVLVLCACGAPTEKSAPEEAASTQTAEKPSKTRGMLAQANMSEEDYTNNYNSVREANDTIVYFKDMNSMLLALQSQKIDRIRELPLPVGQYIAARNENIEANESTKASAAIQYSMGVLQENTELYDLLNSTLEALIADGTIDELVATYIDGCLTSGEDPTPVELPVFEGADTIKIAVTGDLPPLDYVSADGTPAGFNVAILTAIAEAAQVNIELVQVNTGARLTALYSGAVDAVFWFCKTQFEDNSLNEGFSSSDIPEGVSLTTPYYSVAKCSLELAN